MALLNIDNIGSILLDEEENLQIFGLLGERCTTKATTVAQLYVTYPPFHTEWHKKETGVLCFVKDHKRMNYFLRLYCLRRNAMVWEQEIYKRMDYVGVKPYLHQFEGDMGMVAFNFPYLDEAYDFIKNVHKGLDVLDGKMGTFRQSKLLQRTRTFTKADVGDPIDFRHVLHAGFDSNEDISVQCQDEKLKERFLKAGLVEGRFMNRRNESVKVDNGFVTLPRVRLQHRE